MVRSGVNKSFDGYKTGRQANPVDGVVDFVQSSFECCGTNGKSYWYSRADFSDHLPLSCCYKTVEYSTVGTCGATTRSGTGNPFTKGCTQALDDFLHLFTGILAGVLIFAASVKIIAACFACALANAVRY